MQVAGDWETHGQTGEGESMNKISAMYFAVTLFVTITVIAVEMPWYFVLVNSAVAGFNAFSGLINLEGW